MQKTHTQKVRMARKMLSKIEEEHSTPLFQSAEWKKRKEAKAKKVASKRITKK